MLKRYAIMVNMTVVADSFKDAKDTTARLQEMMPSVLKAAIDKRNMLVDGGADVVVIELELLESKLEHATAAARMASKGDSNG